MTVLAADGACGSAPLKIAKSHHRIQADYQAKQQTAEASQVSRQSTQFSGVDYDGPKDRIDRPCEAALLPHNCP